MEKKIINTTQIRELFGELNSLHQKSGNLNYDSIYGCGEINNPKICLVFMNPTARNISASKSWTGLKAPWIGTKGVWGLLYQLGLLNNQIAEQIHEMKPRDWTYKFSEQVYMDIKSRSTYITNLSKSTQKDACKLTNSYFKKHLNLFYKEIKLINPKKIISFGNQVSSVIMKRNIKVANYRKKSLTLTIKEQIYEFYPVYYPVGQGIRNINKAKDDIKWIMQQ